MIAAATILTQLFLSCAALLGLYVLQSVLVRRDATDPINRRFLFGIRVTMVLFAGRGESRAELILTPPHLGRVEVSLTVSGDQTTAQFVAATPAARDALEQALPRLREMLAQAGITLGESNVNTQQGREDRESGRNQAYRGTAAIGAGIEMGAPGSSARWLGQSNGLVDTFA